MADLTEADRELLEAARSVLREHYHPERHTTGAALRTAGGEVYTGVSLKARTGVADVHAEPIAVGRAALDGATELTATAAVQPADADAWAGAADRSGAATRLVSACGRCRELLLAFGPEMWMLLPGEDGPRRRRLAEVPSVE